MGVYVGGHTKITLSEDGTVWPTHADDFGKLKETKPAPKKRWGDDALADEESDGSPRSDWKRHIFRILAEYARAYRLKTTARPVERIPNSLIDVIADAGGVVNWIVVDPARKRRFWQFVDGQDNPPSRVPAVARKKPQGKPSFSRRRSR